MLKYICCYFEKITYKGDIMMKKFLLIMTSIILIINLSGCKKNRDLPENQIIKYNLDNEPRTLDPQICNDQSANTIVMNIFEGLTRLDENGNVCPGVALSWETSSDGLLYTFHLRQDAFWSDKERTPVTAHDFVFGLRRVFDRYTNSPKAYTLFCIKNAKKINIDGADINSLGVTAKDDYTLSIELEYPMDNFLSLLSSSPAMPCNKDFFEKSNGQYGLEPSTIIGNGAFKVKTRYGWDHYNTLNLVANENYKGEKKPVPAGVTFTIGKEMSDVVNLIKNSTVDAAFLPMEEIEKAQSENLPMISFKDTIWGLTFNTKDNTFSNLNVRLGFLKALNREHILSSIPENCEIANDIVINGLMANGQNFRDVAGNNLYLKEDSRAKLLLDSGVNSLKSKKLPTITIICVDTPIVKSIVSNILENLNANLGYYFNMEPVSKSVLMSRVTSSNYQIAFVPIEAESNSAFDFLNTFRSNNNKNVANLSSPEYDKLLNLSLSSSANNSINYLINAEKFLNDNAIFYPMYLQNRYFAHSNKLSKLIVHKYNQGIDFFFATKTK